MGKEALSYYTFTTAAEREMENMPTSLRSQNLFIF